MPPSSSTSMPVAAEIQLLREVKRRVGRDGDVAVSSGSSRHTVS